MSEKMLVTMLGTFSVRCGDKMIDDQHNRMRKVWLLLAYLIYSRSSRCTQEQYISVVKGADAGEMEDPAGRLKALFYRVRTMLNQLWETAGHDLIVRKNGTYAWNTEIPLELDVECFDALCKSWRSISRRWNCTGETSWANCLWNPG